MKKVFKILTISGGVIVAICISLAVGLYVLWWISENPSIHNMESATKRITKLVNKKYPSYEILEMEIVSDDGFYGNDSPVDRFHDANEATVTIKNDVEGLTLNISRNLFRWKIDRALIDYGPNVPNDVYYVRTETKNINDVGNIDEYLKKYLVIPDYNGNYYIVTDTQKHRKYSFRRCRAIYKTMDGYVYIFNEDSLEWEKSTMSYGFLDYVDNYTKIEKKVILDAIDKYISYKNENKEYQEW
ncbi:MAG: hypothetical protein IJK67_04480 [Bacilli bacterium]|nr:hypothetical protein [Bacilli bacterium]